MAIRTLVDLIRRGALAVAESFVRGHSAARTIYEAIKRKFGAEYTGGTGPTRVLELRARESVAAVRNLTAETVLPTLPVTQSGAKIEYNTVVKITDPRIREGGRRRVAQVPATVQSDLGLSAAEVKDIAAGMARAGNFGRGEDTVPGARRADFIIQTSEAIEYDVTILSAYRRS